MTSIQSTDLILANNSLRICLITNPMDRLIFGCLFRKLGATKLGRQGTPIPSPHKPPNFRFCCNVISRQDDFRRLSCDQCSDTRERNLCSSELLTPWLPSLGTRLCSGYKANRYDMNTHSSQYSHAITEGICLERGS